ncbi:MAG: hypothetical protein GX297_05970 [Treponema sp.]|nr:hypothetical protein [Treponema sp.]
MKGISDVFAEIKSFFSDLFLAVRNNTFTDFYQNRKKQIITIYFIIAGLVVIICLFFLISVFSKPKSEIEKILPPLENPLIMPNEPGINDSFQYYRNQRNEWTKEDAQRWFTPPDDSMILELEEANNAIISDILGVAP